MGAEEQDGQGASHSLEIRVDFHFVEDRGLSPRHRLGQSKGGGGSGQ